MNGEPYSKDRLPNLSSMKKCYDDTVTKLFLATLQRRTVFRLSHRTSGKICTGILEFSKGYISVMKQQLALSNKLPAPFEKKQKEVLFNVI